MYKILLIIGLAIGAASACDRPQQAVEKSAEEDYLYEFSKFNLAPYGLKATIMLPDETANIGASTQPEILHQEDGFKWEVMVGPNFQFIIDDYGEVKDKINEKKAALKDLDIFDIRYLVEERDLLVYEATLKVTGEKSSPITHNKQHISYHVYAQKVIDGYTYIFRSREEGYPKNIVDIMTKSFRSVEEVK